jgi:hypothetical protein
MSKPSPEKKPDDKSASKPKVPKPAKPNTKGAPSDKDKDSQYEQKESS